MRSKKGAKVQSTMEKVGRKNGPGAALSSASTASMVRTKAALLESWLLGERATWGVRGWGGGGVGGGGGGVGGVASSEESAGTGPSRACPALHPPNPPPARTTPSTATAASRRRGDARDASAPRRARGRGCPRAAAAAHQDRAAPAPAPGCQRQQQSNSGAWRVGGARPAARRLCSRQARSLLPCHARARARRADDSQHHHTHLLDDCRLGDHAPVHLQHRQQARGHLQGGPGGGGGAGAKRGAGGGGSVGEAAAQGHAGCRTLAINSGGLSP